MKPSRQDIYNSVINRMVRESLDAKHNAFAQDTDRQLIAYIRACAHKLGHTPHQKEIIGWPMITDRFGTWGDALKAAKLPLSRTPNTPSQFAIMLNEIEEQRRIYREKKAQKKLQSRQRQAEQECRKKEHPPVPKKK